MLILLAVERYVEIECKIPEAKIPHSARQAVWPRKKTVSWRVPVELELIMGPMLLSFRCLIDGKEIGTTKVSYRTAK